MKITEIEGDRALDAIVDLLDPLSEISQDKELLSLINQGQKIKAVKYALTNHRKAVIEIMAILNGETVETFKFNLITLPKMVLDILNDEEIMSLFQSQDMTKTSSMPATESTEVAE